MQSDTECCKVVDNELQKVLSRFDAVSSHSQESLENAIKSLENIQQELLQRAAQQQTTVQNHQNAYTLIDNDDSQTEAADLITSTAADNLSHIQKGVLLDAIKKVRETAKCVSSQHKDMHSMVSKVGKSIDKNFMSDYSSVARDFDDERKTSMLNEVICEHFLRQGRLNIAENLIEESGLQLNEGAKLPFLEMHEIVEGLKTKDLAPALSWAERNHELLEEINSTLEFSLTRMNFLMILNSRTRESRLDALHYSKCFQKFAVKHSKDIQQLMGCFLFQSRGIEDSPYAHLISSVAWDSLAEQFSKDACVLLGLPMESPLAISVNAGTKALGPLLHITGVMLQKHVNPVWGAKDELPVEIDLGHDSRFHSIFACPILRQHASENNPPMKLVCGHVVSKDAIHKMSNGQKLKCPYCPVEQALTDAVQLHL